METSLASGLLAALGHEARLAVFRLLVEAGPQGMSAGAIGERLDLAPATLSFHLAHLARAGLVSGQRRSRFIHYSARFDTMDQLIAFLTHNCCQGQPCMSHAATPTRPRKARKPTSTRRDGGARRPARGSPR